MSRLSVSSYLYILIFLFFNLFILSSCGPDSKHIRLKGHLLNFNQGEFLVYSPDGAIAAVDTILVEGGRFTFEPVCEREGTIMIVMSDKQEIPVFVKPGASYSLDGDSHSMKELKIDGGKENKLMNEFRKMTADISDKNIPEREIKDFINNNAASPVCIYLIRHYYLNGRHPDYSKAYDLISTIQKAQPENAMLQMLLSEVAVLRNTAAGNMLPSFSVTDWKDRTLTNGMLNSGVSIFVAQASWDYESTSQLNRILGVRREKDRPWKIIVVSFDAARQQMKNSVHMNDEEGYVVFDGNMSENALASKLAMAQTGAVVIAQNGKIRERGLTGEDLYRELRKY